MLCLLHHGQFSTEVNAVWQDNPYSATFGGPLKDPTEFFTNPEARALFERRLRYIVARWSHASNLLAWELWNEVDYTQQYDGGIQAEWHKHMAQVLHQLDPNDHLVTTSTSMMGKLFGLDAALFGLPELDFSQFHLYGSGDDLTLDLGMTIPGLVGELAALGKPVLAGEVGVDYRGPAETLAMDPGFVGFRDILWLPVVAGSAGIGMHWWWDNLIDPLDLYPLFGPVAQAVSGVDFAAQQFESVTWEQEHTDRQVHAFLLRGDTMGILWLKDAQDQYWRREDAPPVSGLQLEPPDVPEGAWTVTWLDPAAGVPAKSAAWDGASPLAVPTFKSSLAARMEVH
jgi:hypothetical protein